MRWIYENRIGLSVTIIAFLVIAIVFVTSKIVTEIRETPDTIYIEFDMTQVSEEKPKEQPKEKPKPKAREVVDWSSVRNLSSNDAAQQKELKEPKNIISDEELKAAAQKAAQGMQANREAYEKGLDEAASNTNVKAEKPVESSGSKGETSQRKGNVTVRYSFTDPTRHATYLVKPAYRCEGGGEVVVTAILNQGGKVIRAFVESNSGDACHAQAARSAALGSKFNIDSSAPEHHEGTITYIFIPQ